MNNKIYRTATQSDYNALMLELESKGFKWKSGEKPTQVNCFHKYDDTYYYLENGVISLSDKEYYEILYSGGLYKNTPIIEYKGV